MTEEVATQRESTLPGAAWTLGGKMEVRRLFCTQGDPQNSYLRATCHSLSVVLKEAISQCECYVG